jgi:hypothetical protein
MAAYGFQLFVTICVASWLTALSAAQPEVDPLQEIIVRLKRSIKAKDFSMLEEYAPASQKINWGSCNSDIGGVMTVQKAIAILGREVRKGAAIGVFEISDAGMIETFGWSEPDSYIYFVFTKVSGSWKLSSICESPRRSIDFQPKREK